MPQRILIFIFAIAILVLPGLSLFGIFDTYVFRSWKMYASVAIGSAFGEFRIESDDEITHVTSIRDMLGHKRYREQQLYPGSGDVHQHLDHAEDLATVAEPLCRNLKQGERLSFVGRAARRNEWITLELSHTDLCQRVP
ncbi:MAG: hypothetical protein WD397_02680 [Wenzhouxiangellaceae bacterium]